MFYNSKWSKNFQACSQLALKNESKDAPPFWTFFHTNMSFGTAAARFFAGLKKKIFVYSNANILHSGNFWIFFFIFPNQHTTRSYGYMFPKTFFFKNLILVLEMAVLKSFEWKCTHMPLGVNHHQPMHIITNSPFLKGHVSVQLRMDPLLINYVLKRLWKITRKFISCQNGLLLFVSDFFSISKKCVYWPTISSRHLSRKLTGS